MGDGDRKGGSEREGGLRVWAPRVTPPAPELTDEQQLACAFRILAIDGFCENLAGHITWQRPGQDNLLVNPWGLWWREMTASDVCEVDMDAQVVGGKWDVTPAIHIHTELHRRRPDARVVIHNHPYWATVLSAVGVLPILVNQTGAIFYDDLVLVEEYGGEVDSPMLGAELAEAVGDAPVAILANHGVLVTGATVAEAMYRAASLDRVCRAAYDVLLMGKDPLQMPPGAVKGIKQSFLERAVDVYWAGATRLLIKDEPEVLS